VERIVISLKKKELDTIESLSALHNVPVSAIFNLLVQEGLKSFRQQGYLKLYSNPNVGLKESAV
jgi:hypothetical protein